jgi:isoleucyl-tRNA synthetase
MNTVQCARFLRDLRDSLCWTDSTEGAISGHAHGRFGRWAWDISKVPTVRDILDRHTQALTIQKTAAFFVFQTNTQLSMHYIRSFHYTLSGSSSLSRKSSSRIYASKLSLATLTRFFSPTTPHLSSAVWLWHAHDRGSHFRHMIYLIRSTWRVACGGVPMCGVYYTAR